MGQIGWPAIHCSRVRWWRAGPAWRLRVSFHSSKSTIPCFRMAKYLEWILLQIISSPIGKGSSKDEKPLPVGEFSDKQGHANEKRFSHRRSDAPWDGGGDGPIALRERG